MIAFGKVGEHIVAEPFRPFRIVLTCGKKLEISQPEMILLGRSSVRVYATNGASGTKNSNWEDVSLIQMVGIEPIAG